MNCRKTGSPKSEIHAIRKAVAEFHASTQARERPYAISETAQRHDVDQCRDVCDVLVARISSAKRHVYWHLSLQLRTWKSRITSRWLRWSPGSNHSKCRDRWINVWDSFIKWLWFIKFQNTILKFKPYNSQSSSSYSKQVSWISKLRNGFDFRSSKAVALSFRVLYFSKNGSKVASHSCCINHAEAKLFPYLVMFTLFVTIYGHVAFCPSIYSYVC